MPSIKIVEGKISVKDKKVHRIFYDKLNEEFYIDTENPEYLLHTNLSESISSAAQTSSGSDGRYKYVLSLTYTLNSKTGKKVSSGSVKSISSYESSISRFTTYSAEKDMLDKLIISIIDKLKLKIITNIDNNSQL
ncbi:hypothetical protein ACFL0U_01500 [Pseudomonadota bacterium]